MMADDLECRGYHLYRQSVIKDAPITSYDSAETGIFSLISSLETNGNITAVIL